MPQILLRSNKKYSFRISNAKELTTEQLRDELEALYTFIDKDITNLVKQLEAKLQAQDLAIAALQNA